MKKSIIKTKDRKKIDEDPFYQTCSLFGWFGHECEGRITKEHALIHQGRKIQELWAIIPLCAKYHSVDEFQDNGLLNKELNMWVALNRATDKELFDRKGIDYIHQRDYLNEKYGPWYSKADSEIIY